MANEMSPFNPAYGSLCFTSIGSMLNKLSFQLCKIIITTDYAQHLALERPVFNYVTSYLCYNYATFLLQIN